MERRLQQALGVRGFSPACGLSFFGCGFAGLYYKRFIFCFCSKNFQRMVFNRQDAKIWISASAPSRAWKEKPAEL